ncbi:copper-binding transcription factor [Dispira parvispora]|uniref:Copper-binding transcription factor n=1 Tax=Dispira parvispora TaxID=1520584 RepID=A0A9W8ANI6_9FUNG|nr:copper-binding transcription factor [Dispira parvispora]
MLLIDGKKYSCHKCIKGHRASSCTHRDRELVEVRPKGRPQSQCPKCRELRKTRSIHTKCVCGEESYTKRRKVSSTNEIESLLNPCDCSKTAFCICCRPVFDKVFKSSSRQLGRGAVKGNEVTPAGLAASPASGRRDTRSSSTPTGNHSPTASPDAFVNMLYQTVGKRSFSDATRSPPKGSSCCGGTQTALLADGASSPSSTSTANIRKNNTGTAGGCQLSVGGSCGCGCDCSAELHQLLIKYPNAEDLKQVLMSKYGSPQEQSSTPHEATTTTPALDGGENRQTHTPFAPASCCSSTATSTGTSKSCCAKKPSSSLKGSQKRSTKCACQGNTCRCSKGCSNCSCRSPITGDNAFINNVTPPIDLPDSPRGETSDTLPQVTDKDTVPSAYNIYIDPYGAPSCACGCDKPSQECRDCMKDLCEEYLLRPRNIS